MVVVLLQELLDFELVVEFKVEDIRLVPEFHIYINSVAFSESLIDDLKVVRVNCFDSLCQVPFVIANNFGNSLGSADGALFVFSLVMFVDPCSRGTVFTEELPAALAVIADIFEIELALAGLTSLGFGRLQNDGFCLWFRRQIEGSMATSVLHIHIDTSRKITLEHLQVTRRGCLVDRAISVHINVEW